MFGIHKLIITVVAILVAGAVLLGIGVCAGCVPENAAFAQKNVSETSNDSVNLSGDALITTDPLEIILAKAEEKEKIIRAEKEPWRIIAYTVGIPVGVGLLSGVLLALIYFKAYLAKSPWDNYRKERV